MANEPAEDEAESAASLFEDLPAELPRIAAGTGFTAAVALAAARGLGLVGWPWALVLAPFTIVGVAGACFYVERMLGSPVRRLAGRLARGRSYFSPRTPPPDRLERPRGADGRWERALARDPEILAAVCHGLQVRRQVRTVFGRPVSDPWGIYEEAIVAPPERLEELRLAAGRHARRFRTKHRRRGSKSKMLRDAVGVFERCARKVETGRSSPNCAFEHATVVFGVEHPTRDAQLRKLAPRVARLLRRKYPQLQMAGRETTPADERDDHRKEAVRTARELARLRKKHGKVSHKLEQAEEERDAARGQAARLQRALDRERGEARDEARRVREEALREADEAMEEERAEDARRIDRLEIDMKRLAANLEEVTEERDEFERALLDGGDDDEAVEALHPIPADALAGLRVLLVGGHDRQIPPIREELEGYGVQVLHEDSLAAANLVGGVHVVVLWARFLSHAIADNVKRECRVGEIPFVYWTRASPGTLVALLAETTGDGAAPSAEARQ